MLNNVSIPFDRENPFECRKSPVWQYSLDELHITANNKVQSAVCRKASKKPPYRKAGSPYARTLPGSVRSKSPFYVSEGGQLRLRIWNRKTRDTFQSLYHAGEGLLTTLFLWSKYPLLGLNSQVSASKE